MKAVNTRGNSSRNSAKKTHEVPKVADHFSRFLKLVYQFTARDYLAELAGSLAGQGVFSDYLALVSQIEDGEGFQSFLRELPSKKEMEKLIKTRIREEYGGLQEKVAQIEEQKQKALENPTLDYGEFSHGVWAETNRQLRENFTAGKVDSQRGYETQRVDLESKVAKAVQRHLSRKAVKGLREGDLLRVVALEGIDFEADLKPTYYFGGEEADLPLGSEGELLEVDSNGRLLAYFVVKGQIKEWQLHPKEVEAVGENRYQRLVDEQGDYQKAAAKMIEEVESSLKPEHLEKARQRIRKVFAGATKAVTQNLREEYGLSDSQLQALQKGKDFDYELPAAVKEAKVPFDQLAHLAFYALNYNTRKKKSFPDISIDSETKFRKFILETAQDNPGLIKSTLDELTTVLLKQDDLKERELRIKGEKKGIFAAALNHLLKEKEWFRRLILYNDRALYRGGDPFSPPSEELPRVIKLEVGDGCNYARCTFCTEYAQAKFFVRTPEDFQEHAEEVRRRLGEDIQLIQRVFLSGGNTFVLPTETILEYLKIVDKLFGRQREHGYNPIRRVEAFTRTEGILRKSVNEMQRLYDQNLRLLYWGVETGSEEVLKYVNKGITRAEMEEAGKKIRRTPMWLSLMIMPGLGGIRHYEDHVRGTREMINLLHPRFTTFHTVTPRSNTVYALRMNEEMRAGTNRPLTDEEVVEQIYDIVQGMDEEYDSLVATYYPPSAKISINPISFRGYLQRREKSDILHTLAEYFSRGKKPSLDLAETNLNKGSDLRRLAQGRVEAEVVQVRV